MKTPLVIALTVAFVLSAGSVLAALNNACKSGHHAWCAPSSSLRHRIKAGLADEPSLPRKRPAMASTT